MRCMWQKENSMTRCLYIYIYHYTYTYVYTPIPISYRFGRFFRHSKQDPGLGLTADLGFLTSLGFRVLESGSAASQPIGRVWVEKRAVFEDARFGLCRLRNISGFIKGFSRTKTSDFLLTLCLRWFDIVFGLQGFGFVAVQFLGFRACKIRATHSVAVSDTGGALMYVMGIWAAKRFREPRPKIRQVNLHLHAGPWFINSLSRLSELAGRVQRIQSPHSSSFLSVNVGSPTGGERLFPKTCILGLLKFKRLPLRCDCVSSASGQNKAPIVGSISPNIILTKFG